MNQLIGIVNTYGYLIGAITFFVYILKAAIDFWFVTELEKKLMTDYQKLKGFVSKLMITIVPNVILTFLLTLGAGQGVLNSNKELSEGLLIVVFLLIIFLLNIFFHLTMIFIERILNLKSDYIISIDNESWNIKRLTKNNQLLLVNNNKEFLLIEDWKERKIRQVINKENYTFKIYSESLKFRRVLCVNIFILVVSILLFVIYSNAPINSVFLFIIYIAFLSILILFANWVEYRREFI